MAETEEYFPRGGKKPTVTYFKQSGNVSKNSGNKFISTSPKRLLMYYQY